ncbi:MAG: hypothetical protein ACTHJ5_08085 [Ilyomonas sp.]
MTTKVLPQIHNETDIKNLEDLRKEILNVKARVIMQEEQLKDIKKNFPFKALNFVAGSVVPLFLRKNVVLRLFGVAKNVTGLVSSLKSSGKGNLKEGLLNAAKKVGIVTALKAAINIYKNRKQKPSTS